MKKKCKFTEKHWALGFWPTRIGILPTNIVGFSTLNSQGSIGPRNLGPGMAWLGGSPGGIDATESANLRSESTSWLSLKYLSQLAIKNPMGFGFPTPAQTCPKPLARKLWSSRWPRRLKTFFSPMAKSTILLSSNLGRWWNWWICLLSSAILGYSRDPKWSLQVTGQTKNQWNLQWCPLETNTFQVGKCVYKKLGWSFTQFPLLMKGRDSQTKIRGGPVSPCTSYQLLGECLTPVIPILAE